MIKRYLALILSSTLALQACSSVGSGKSGTYVVQRGDSLSLIAQRHNMSLNQLISLNGISNPDRISVGQRLQIKGPVVRSSRSTASRSSPSIRRNTATRSRATAGRSSGSGSYASSSTPRKASGPAYQDKASTRVGGWIKPTEGSLAKGYNPNIPGQKGIQIAGQINQPIIAANNGEIVFAGQGNTGYGQLIIIKHDSNTYSAYGYLSSINVREGDRVRKADRIATMGQSIDGRTVLYFEIRASGTTLNPLSYIQL